MLSHDEQSEVDAFARTVGDFFNRFFTRSRMDETIKAICNIHRTLQQNVTRFCVRWLETLADPEFRYDGRNEASVMLARKFVERMDVRDRALPMV